MLNQNAETATTPSITGFGQNAPKNLEDLEHMKKPESHDLIDPVQELYFGPDSIEKAEEIYSNYELKNDRLCYERDVIHHSLSLEFMKKYPSAQTSKIKSMVVIDERMKKIEDEIYENKKLLKAAKIVLNKVQNKYISARKLASQ